MKKIVVASKNPVKVQAVKNGFLRMYPDESPHILCVSAESGVSEQPTSDQETLQGAINRAQAAEREVQNADYWVGIEGGIEEHDGEMSAFAWVVIKSAALLGKGRTGTFYLPPQVANLIQQGVELGEEDDIVFNQSNSKQKNGAIGILSGNAVTRTQLYEQAVIFALVPFKNPQLYSQQKDQPTQSNQAGI